MAISGKFISNAPEMPADPLPIVQNFRLYIRCVLRTSLFLANNELMGAAQYQSVGRMSLFLSGVNNHHMF